MATNGTSPAAPSWETCQSTFESALAMTLHLWQPLSFAVENNLGGGDGVDKRDWFAGAVSELFETTWQASGSVAAAAAAAASAPAAASTLAEDLLMDVESRLLQIMDDEFDTVVDDGTAYDVATQIVGLWSQCRRGNFADADALRTRWERSRGQPVTGLFHAGPAPDEDSTWATDDEDDSGEDEDDKDDEGKDKDGDVDMGEAPALVGASARKPPPEVDEDGFTTVARKKR